MKNLKTSAISDRFKLAKLALVAGALLFGASAQAATIVIPDGDFSTVGGAGTINGGVIGNYTAQQIGTGPWSATGTGILSLLVAPSVTIGSGPTGTATFSSLLSLTTLGTVNNSVRLFNNNIGTSFVTGQVYTFTADVSSATTLTVNLLSNAGFGISLNSAGTERATTLGSGAAINLLTANTARLTLNYTAIAGDNNNNIGVSLFAGQGSGLANVGLLGSVTFDNLTLTAVPEPATWAFWGGAASLAVVICQRRKTRVKTNS